MTLLVGHLLEVRDVFAELDLVREPGVRDGLVVEVHRPLVLDRLEEEALLQAGSENSHCIALTGSFRTAGRPSGRPGLRIRQHFERSMHQPSAFGARPPKPRRCGAAAGAAVDVDAAASTGAALLCVDVLGLVHLDRRLLGGVARLHVQVVRRLHAALPRREVDVHHVAEVTRLEVHVAADRLVDPLLRAGRDLEERVRRQLEARLVHLLDRVRDRRDALDVALADRRIASRVDSQMPSSCRSRTRFAFTSRNLPLLGRAAEDLRELRVEARASCRQQDQWMPWARSP